MKRKFKLLLCFVTVFVIAITTAVTLTACDQGFTDWVVVKEATCTEDGLMQRHDKLDESNVENKVIPAEGHLWGENDGWQIITEPTHTSEGIQKRVCKRCGLEEVEPIDILESAYHIDIKDGDKLLDRIYVEEDGIYEITLPEKHGYECEQLVDADGNDFDVSGVITESKTVNVVWKILPTTTFDELVERAAADIDKILIDADIVITDSVYVVGQTEIYVEKNCVISRSPDFLGDMFVIGENAQGESALIAGSGSAASLTLKAKNGATLTFDGNKANVTKDVNGTCFLVLYSSVVNMYDSVTVSNFNKTANAKIVESKYAVSYPQKIGGAGMIVVNGTFNMYGGSFVNNSVNCDETFEGDDSETDEARVSSCGGAIYNYTAVNIYGGTFENNEAARGGAIYNYRATRVYGGTFKNNKASVYAGAVYLPGSQYSVLYLGSNQSVLAEDEEVATSAILFEGNTADKSGGAIFGQMKNSINIYGNTTFQNNVANGYNGGAINTSGALVIVNAVFEGNIAASKGGAIYAYYSNPELTTRQVDIRAGLFINNRASKGGAIAFSALSEDFEKGAIGFIGDVTFKNNIAHATSTQDPELPDLDIDDEAKTAAEGETSAEKNFNGNGGAIYISRKSSVSLSGSVKFQSNQAERNGGAIYITGESELIIDYSVTFAQNTTGINGGAIYVHGEKTTLTIGNWTLDTQAEETEEVQDPTEVMFVAEFIENTCSGKGGAIYITNGSVSDGATLENPVDVKIDNAKFQSNAAIGNGGAIYCYTGSTLTVKNCDFTLNQTQSTAQGGGAVYLTNATANIADSTFSGNFAVKKNGGAIGAYSGAILNVSNTVFDGNKTENAEENGGGAMYLSGAVVTLNDCTFKNNNSAKNGGAIGIYSAANVTFTGSTVFEANNAATSGGAIYTASSGNVVTINGNSLFKSNHANTNGGVMYATGPSTVVFENVTATENSAKSGGFLYYTTTDTVVTIKAGSATDNTATSGSAIWSNTNKAKLVIKGTADSTAFKVDGQNVVMNGTSVAGKDGKMTIDYFTED